MDKEKKRNKKLIILLYIMGFAGIILISYDFIVSKINLTFETVNLQLYGNEEPKVINEGTKEESKIIEEEEKKGNNNNNKTPTSSKSYFGYIEIPKINLVQGLVPQDSKENNVNVNIQTIYPSDYPDKENGNLILAAHSGTSSISYFKNLYKLENDDQIYIIYNNNKYIYNIINIYTVPKNGSVSIYRPTDKTTVTLITCTKNDENTQTVYIGQLISKEGV